MKKRTTPVPFRPDRARTAGLFAGRTTPTRAASAPYGGGGKPGEVEHPDPSRVPTPKSDPPKPDSAPGGPPDKGPKHPQPDAPPKPDRLDPNAGR